MSFARGLEAGSRIVQDIYDTKEARRRHDEEMSFRKAAEHRAQTQFAAEQDDRARVRSAADHLQSLDGGSVYESTGLPVPRGPAPGEEGLGMPPGMGAQELPAGLARTRPVSDAERTAAAQRLALARNDLNAWRGLETDRRSSSLQEARRAELKRLSSVPEKEIVSMFQQSINANPDMPAMIDFDPKSRKYVMVSQVPGVPTQTLSKAEMLQSLMGAWEMGNGDYNAGIQAMISGVQNQRSTQDKNFERSRVIAGGNADLHFAGRRDDRDGARLVLERERVGIARQSAADRRTTERMGSAREFVNERGEVEVHYPVTNKAGEVEWRKAPLPSGLKPSRAAGGGAPREVPAEGTMMQDQRGVYMSDGRGGRLAPDAVPPSKRASHLSKMGFSKAEAEQLQWHPDGRAVVLGGMVYDASDPQDMVALRQELATQAETGVLARELQQQAQGDPERRRFTRPPVQTPEGRMRQQAEANRLRSMGGGPGSFGLQR